MSPVAGLVVLFLGLAIATPVAFSMGIAGTFGLWQFGGWQMVRGVLATAPLSAVSSYDLLPVPMFLLMAELVLLSGVADSLFRAAAAWVGRVPGGLGMATALAGAAFGAVCGTSTAAAATLSSTTLPAMIRQGYEPKMAAGVVAISGTLAMLIPPAVALVLFGLIAEVSVGKLLIGGLVPAAMVTATIMLTVLVLVLLDPSRAPPVARTPWRERLRLLGDCAPMLLLFGFVTGTIYLGMATPPEASAVGAFGGMLLALQRRKLTLRSLHGCLVRAMHGTCMIMMIILGAAIFGYFFALTQVTQDLVAWVSALEVSRWLIIVALLLGYIVLGMFMDQTAILFLTVPVVIPVIKALGFDPVWFGVIKIVTAEVGMITPPIGLNCFVVARYSGRPVSEVFRGSYPHFLAHLIVIAILTAFPGLILWLPNQME